MTLCKKHCIILLLFYYFLRVVISIYMYATREHSDFMFTSCLWVVIGISIILIVFVFLLPFYYFLRVVISSYMYGMCGHSYFMFASCLWVVIGISIVLCAVTIAFLIWFFRTSIRPISTLLIMSSFTVLDGILRCMLQSFCRNAYIVNVSDKLNKLSDSKVAFSCFNNN